MSWTLIGQPSRFLLSRNLELLVLAAFSEAAVCVRVRAHVHTPASLPPPLQGTQPTKKQKFKCLRRGRKVWGIECFPPHCCIFILQTFTKHTFVLLAVLISVDLFLPVIRNTIANNFWLNCVCKTGPHGPAGASVASVCAFMECGSSMRIMTVEQLNTVQFSTEQCEAHKLKSGNYVGLCWVTLHFPLFDYL